MTHLSHEELGSLPHLKTMQRMQRPLHPLLATWSNVNVKLLSRVQLCDPMDCSLPGSSVHGIFQAIVLEYWSGLPFPSPRDLPNPGVEPGSPAS